MVEDNGDFVEVWRKRLRECEEDERFGKRIVDGNDG